MDMFIVEGGVPLRGSVRCSVAKNSVLPLLAATLLTDEPCRLVDVPRLRDVDTMVAILRGLGVEATWLEDGSLRTQVVDESCVEAPWDLVRRMRASICTLGPLVGRRHRARVSFPGGCVFGHRPVDLHLKGIRALGADIRIEGGYIDVDAPKLRGAEVFLGGPFGSSVTGTQNVVTAAVLAEGTTVIDMAACEPEVEDLCRFLNAMGADIRGAGTPRITIRGVRRLHGAVHRPIPDRIEAGTLMVAGVLTDGDVTVTGCEPAHLRAVVDKLVEMGGDVERVGDDALRVRRREALLRPADIVTLPFPGFPTDMQAQLMVLQSLAHGVSLTTEKIYPDRFMHISELTRMGAEIRKEGSSAIIAGVKRLSGAPVMASDLRASAALVLAGLVAEGKTTVHRVYHIDRGYERIEERLSSLGAKVRRVNDDNEESADMPASSSTAKATPA
jgi:UDP-N-acetylglucosamine 1-carboxyvinyltransferase